MGEMRKPTMSNLPPTKAEAMKVATVAPSRDTTVLMMQLNCWKGPGEMVPGTCIQGDSHTRYSHAGQLPMWLNS